MKINKYPDGTSYIVVNQEKEVTTFRINTYEDLHHLEQFVDAYNFNYNEKPTIVIPNLLDAQADRRFADNQSSGLKIVLKRLNSMNAHFKIFHPHNAEVVEAMMDNVEIIDNTGFIQHIFSLLTFELKDKVKYPDIIEDKLIVIKERYYDKRVMDNLILMSADAGGFKPLMKLCDTIGWEGETYSASKARTKDGMKQLIDRVDFQGKDILIIDDISVYGGTFKGLSKLLRERNCGKLYLAVSHMTVQNLGEDPVTNYFDKVFTTNSKFEHYYLDARDSPKKSFPENLEIVKLF